MLAAPWNNVASLDETGNTNDDKARQVQEGSLKETPEEKGDSTKELIEAGSTRNFSIESFVALPNLGVEASMGGDTEHVEDLNGLIRLSFRLHNDLIYITELPTEVELDMLDQMFTSMGFNIARSELRSSESTNASYALVQLASLQEAHAAIQMFDGQYVTLDAPSMAVRYASKQKVLANYLYVTRLPMGITQEALQQIFADAGFSIQNSRVILNALGSAYLVQVGSMEQARAAILALNGRVLNGKCISMNDGSVWPPKGCKSGKGRGRTKDSRKGFGILNKNTRLRLCPAWWLIEESLVPLTLDHLRKIDWVHTTMFEDVLDDQATGRVEALGVVDDVNDTKPLSVRLSGDHIHIINLPAEVESQLVDDMFTSVGLTIQWSKLEKDTRTNTVNALIQFTSLQEAQEAIRLFDGQVVTLDVLSMAVRYASEDQALSDYLYVTHLPAGMTPQALRQIFADGGFTIHRSSVIPDAFGISYLVQLGTSEEAVGAIQAFDGKIFNINPIRMTDGSVWPPKGRGKGSRRMLGNFNNVPRLRLCPVGRLSERRLQTLTANQLQKIHWDQEGMFVASRNHDASPSQRGKSSRGTGSDAVGHLQEGNVHADTMDDKHIKNVSIMEEPRKEQLIGTVNEHLSWPSVEQDRGMLEGVDMSLRAKPVVFTRNESGGEGLRSHIRGKAGKGRGHDFQRPRSQFVAEIVSNPSKLTVLEPSVEAFEFEEVVEKMKTRIFVRSIPWGTTEQTLWEELGQYGHLDGLVLRPDEVQEGKMWAHAWFHGTLDSDMFVDARGGEVPLPSGLLMSLASEHAELKGSSNNWVEVETDLGNQHRKIEHVTLYLKCIPWGTSASMLRTELKEFGDITSIVLRPDVIDSRWMAGVVTFAESESARNLMAVKGRTLVMPHSNGVVQLDLIDESVG